MSTPKNNEAEITLIGTGGYGECLVIHLGDQNWVIVDSCINPDTKSPLSLEYLKSINVSFHQVVLVLCTHWHDDHIRGISLVLEACTNAKFSFSKAHDVKKFITWVSIESMKEKIEPLNSSTLEFYKCLEICKNRSGKIASALENKVLKKIEGDGFVSQLISLSPSEYTMEKFDKEIGELIEAAIKSNIKILSADPNSRSVALYLKLGEHRAILGADLEVTKDVNEGWHNIIHSNEVIDKKASLFKIPHHGSENGYHDDIWTILLADQPLSKLTPYNKNLGLPEPEMLQKYSSLTDKLFITSPFIGKKAKKRNSGLEKFIKKMNYKISEIKYKKGIIQSRIDLLNAEDFWKVTLFENSIKINELNE